MTGATINDVVMASFSSALHEYLGIKGESKINLLIPANIRFKFYENADDVKIENKFSGVPIVMPIVSTMEEAYGKIGKITKEIKKSFANIYTSYALTFWMTLLSPRHLPRLILHKASMKFTCSFSNTPGPI